MQYTRLFISGLQCNQIWQRLLENKTLDQTTALERVRALEMDKHHSKAYIQNKQYENIAAQATTSSIDDCNHSPDVCASTSENCYFCWQARHARAKWPAI